MKSITLFLESKDIPKEILKKLSKIQYDNFTDEEKYIIKTPDQVLKQKQAICYDLVELQREMFNKANYETKTFFSCSKLKMEDDVPTHTYMIFKENNKYFWIEISWHSYRAIHGPFSSYKDGVRYVEKQLKSSDNWKNVITLEYPKFNYRNMNIIDFGNHILKIGKRI